jgi:uncharacterized membrane protein
MRPTLHPSSRPIGERASALDSLRGFAMLWMTGFHLCFDLQHFGHLQADFYNDPFWTVQRSAIVTLFVFCAGMSQALAAHQGQGWPRFWRRWRQIALCAVLVTVGSVVMYPDSFIYFGILHGLALMLIVARATQHWGRWLWPLGALAMLLPILAKGAHQQFPALEFLNTPAFNWLGLINRKPVTEDYAPLMPWLGAMWWGVASGQWCLQHRAHWLTHGGVPLLARLGRWSLSYYMVHQPVLIGGLLAWGWLSRG